MKYYAALRVPQVLKNSEVKGVQSGHINLEDAIELEKQTLKKYDYLLRDKLNLKT